VRDEGKVRQSRPSSASHWPKVSVLFRHTHGSHALNGRPGGKGVPAASGTTSGYLTTARDARLAAMKGFGEKDAAGGDFYRKLSLL